MNINKLIKPIEQFECIRTNGIRKNACKVEPVRELEDNCREAIRLLNRIQKVVNGRGDNVTKVGKVKDLLI